MKFFALFDANEVKSIFDSSTIQNKVFILILRNFDVMLTRTYLCKTQKIQLLKSLLL